MASLAGTPKAPLRSAGSLADARSFHPVILRAFMRRALAIGGLLGMVLWAVWSYRSGGLAYVLVTSAPDGGSGLQALRTYILGWGALAPAIYVMAVTVEVLIAPFPGTLLYAPAGAIFGGFWGGTMSLAGNVLGAAIATWIGRALGEDWVARRLAKGDLDRYRRRFLHRATWIVFLLRLNPFTSSDIVSYIAGAAGVPVRKVALGTFAGMIPLCYAQAYLSAAIFERLPGGVWLVAGLGVAYLVVVLVLLLKPARR